MDMHEIITRQLHVDPATITRDVWAGLSAFERTYVAVNCPGYDRFPEDIRDQVWLTLMSLSPFGARFVEVD
jgi:hypothetical protein